MANNNHFNLTLDTLAPSGSITSPGIFIKQNGTLTINKGDATFMKVWFNANPTGTTLDPEYPANPEAAAISKQTAFVNAGDYYYHMTLIDGVNNESIVYNTTKIVFDPNAPTISNAYMADPDTGSHTITNDLTGVVLAFDFSDGTGAGVSGVVSADVTGDDIDPIHLTFSSSESSYSGTFDWKAGTQDGLKTISIVVTDAAGNVSTATSVSITLDTILDTPVITIEDSSGNPLPAYINYRNVYLHLTDADTGITGYKLWEGTTADEPGSYTTHAPGTALSILEAHTLAANDGVKTIYAKVIDQAGTEAYATPVSITFDATAPVNVSVSSNVNVISNITGHDTAILTLSGSDATSGIASYTLKCGNTVIDGPSTTIPVNFSLTSANSMAEGSNTITITVTDNAGNTSTDTCTVTLDTTNPTASIATLNTWYKEHFGIQATLADNVAVGGLYVWTSTTPEDLIVPSGASFIPSAAGIVAISAANIYWATAESANNYMHVKVVDTVGNAGYAHEQFGYDSVKPTTPTISFEKSAYDTQSASTTIQFSSDTSGVVAMCITGDILNPTTSGSWEVIPQDRIRAVTLTPGDGLKNVYVKVKDAAGNESDLSPAATCELDTSDPSGRIDLYEADNTHAKPAISPLATFTARITISDSNAATDPDPRVYYKFWGAFTVGSQSAQGTTEPAEWTEFTPDAGQAYLSLTNLYCTSGDGVKEFNLKIKDSAGNTPETIVSSFTYDTTAPEVTIVTVDYNIVSKEKNSLRRNSDGEIPGAYADECKFTFRPEEVIIEYKVCAYGTQADAEAVTDPEDETPIPQAGGSVNMHGTGNSSSPVDCLIKGADLETALGGPGNDGAHIIVVYVKDTAGQWSSKAIFTTN